MQSLALIVNADDFGISTPVNAGIVKAHISGIVTSTTLLATGDAFEHALTMAKAHPRLDLGLHLALVGQRPLLSPSRIPSLVDGDGMFHESVFAFTRRYLTSRIRDEEIERELDAQAELVRGRVSISHVDSHQHVHMLPGVRRIVIRLCNRHRIRAMRWPAERIRLRSVRSLSDVVRSAQLAALNLAGRIGGRSDVLSPDQFVGFLHGGRFQESTLLETLRTLPSEGLCELMCHPGLPASAERYPSWGYAWPQELEALTAPRVIDYVRERGIKLTNYGDWLAMRSDA
jgi:hopanoid biosynthesis associated protein HpnK